MPARVPGMALGATVHVFDIELANSDRGVYRALQLRVPRHPSESGEYLLTRILAYCLEYTEGIKFTNGLFEPDEPAIEVRDLTGVLSAWIDVGAPEAARLHRASKAAPRVAVYTYKDAALLAARLSLVRIHRVEALELYALDAEWLSKLAGKLARRMEFSLTIAEQHVYLSHDQETLTTVIERVVVGRA